MNPIEHYRFAPENIYTRLPSYFLYGPTHEICLTNLVLVVFSKNINKLSRQLLKIAVLHVIDFI